MRTCGLEPQAEASTDVFSSAFASFVRWRDKEVAKTFSYQSECSPGRHSRRYSFRGDEGLERPPALPTELRAPMMDPAGLEPATWRLQGDVVLPAFAAIFPLKPWRRSVARHGP